MEPSRTRDSVHADRSICAVLNGQIAAHGPRVALTFLNPNGQSQDVTYGQIATVYPTGILSLVLPISRG